MKKAIPVVAVLVIAAVVFYFINESVTTQVPTAAKTAANQSGSQPTTAGAAANSAAGLSSKTAGGKELDDIESDELEEQEKKAVETYKTADDALKAIKAAAADYDDRILEQFTEVGDDCSWCDQVYAQVKEWMLAPDTAPEQRSYYAELMAVSGKVSNVATLIDAIKAAPNQETADALSEALELTIGKNDVTQFLGDQITPANDSLKESLIAAITNQGTRLAADILYKATVEKGDADGFYSLGIGLGELVPDEATMPYLQELALKRDPYSHLAVKALLNGGIDGLKLVMSSVTNSPNPEFDEKVLNEAVDHVPYDDETRDYLTKLAETEKDPLVVKFAKRVVENMKADDTAAEEELPMTTMPPADEIAPAAGGAQPPSAEK